MKHLLDAEKVYLKCIETHISETVDAESNENVAASG